MILVEKKPTWKVFKIVHIEKKMIGYALPCSILSLVSGIKAVLLLAEPQPVGAGGMVTNPTGWQHFVSSRCQGGLSPTSAWQFFMVKAGGWCHKVVHKSQPLVDADMLNNSTPLIAAVCNLSMSPPLLLYLVINHFMSRLSELNLCHTCRSLLFLLLVLNSSPKSSFIAYLYVNQSDLWA